MNNSAHADTDDLTEIDFNFRLPRSNSHSQNIETPSTKDW